MKIGTRLITYLVVTLILVMGVHAIINIIQSNRNLRDEVRRSAEKMARIVADGARIHLKEENDQHLRQLLSILGRLEGVLDLVVHSPDGKILGRFFVPIKNPPPQPEIERSDSIPMAGVGREIKWRGSRAYEHILPVSSSDGKFPAFVHVVMDLSFIEHHNAEARWINIGTIGAMTALLAFLFFLFTRKSVVLPLEELTHVVTAYRRGKWEGKLDVTKGDEIGALASEFKDMATEIEEANRRLMLEHEQQRAVLHSLREGVIVLDPSKHVALWNPAALMITGIPDEEEPADHLRKFMEAIEPYLQGAIGDIAQGKRKDALLRPIDCKCMDGQVRRVQMNLRKLEEGPMSGGVVLVIEDVTEQEALAQQVMRTERLASIGQLVSGIAHEIGTPLNVISGRVQQTLSKLESKHPATEKLSPIVSQIDRITRLVRRLLEFSRGGAIQIRRMDLNHEIREVTRLLESSKDQEDVEMELDLASALPPMEADAGQMQQLVLNLCVNALQAMPDGGRLKVVTEKIDDEIILTVSDTGQGIEPKNIDRVFDPFFTTKDVGEGTGLGLAICHRIVEDHGGRIEVSGSEGVGTTFRVRFPLKTGDAFHGQPVA